MSLFDQLKKPEQEPVIALIAGEQGLGKTTLAAMLPKPVMIRAEDGTSSIEGMDVALFPVANKLQDVKDQIKMLGTEEHDFKTLVIDSTTAYDSLIVSDIQKRNKTANLSACDGGFGGGFHTVRSEHENLFNLCKKLRTVKKMNIVFIAHTETEILNPPDSEEYSRYTIQLTKSKQVDCSKVYTNNCDLVAFIKLNRIVMDGRAQTTGDRVITCHPTASHVSKNRYGIETDLPFELGVNPFNGVIKQLTTTTTTSTTTKEGK